MTHFSSVLAWSLVGLIAASPAAFADEIVLGADPWCPYNCDPASEKPGYMIEIAQEALGLHGHDIEYIVVSWARGLRQAETGEINGVVGAVPEEAPDFIFGPPIGTYQDTVMFRQGETVSPDTLADRTDLRIGAINGYEYYGHVSDYIERHADDRSLVQFASGDDALQQNIRKLVAGRVDMVAEVRAVAEHAVLELGITDQVDIISTDDSSDVFIAFSPALETSDTYARQLADGVAQLKASGRYAEILATYGLAPE